MPRDSNNEVTSLRFQFSSGFPLERHRPRPSHPEASQSRVREAAVIRSTHASDLHREGILYQPNATARRPSSFSVYEIIPLLVSPSLFPQPINDVSSIKSYGRPNAKRRNASRLRQLEHCLRTNGEHGSQLLRGQRSFHIACNLLG